MYKFLKKLGFFIILVFAGWLCLEIFYRNTPNNYTEKTKNINTIFNDCETLIVGNSHTLYGLNPDYFEAKTFNLANKSQTLFYDKLLLEKYILSLKKLKYVILSVEYSSLSTNDNNPELAWRSYFYEYQMKIDTKMHSAFDIKTYSLALSPPFSITLQAIKKYYLFGTLTQCMPNGWTPYEGVSNEHNNAVMGKTIVSKHENNSVNFHKNIERLKDIVSLCKQNGINVIIVTMPVTSHYAENINKEKLAGITATCNAIAKTNDAKYINLFDDKRFKNSDFYDTDHLNTIGAKKCSQIINELVN